MAKIDINFNNTNYSIDEASLSTASAALRNHLSTVMNGSGAVINLGGTSYNIDSTKLSAATNAFVSHLGTIAGGSDTLYWDGNTEGLAYVQVDEFITMYKISDVVPTLDDIAKGGKCVSSFGTISFENYFDAEGIIVAGKCYSVPAEMAGKPAAVLEGAAFPEAGLYIYDPTTTSITINGYTGFPSSDNSGSKLTVNGVEYSIDPTKLSGAVADLETVLGGLNSGNAGGCDTLYWDGNTEGLVCVSDCFYKVSDAVPTDEQLKLCTMATNEGYEGKASDIWEDMVQAGAITEDIVYLNAIVVVKKGDTSIADFTFHETGVYFVFTDGTYVTSLTIPNYTGF